MKTLAILFNVLILVASAASGQAVPPAARATKIDTAFNRLINSFSQRRSFGKDTVRLPTLLVNSRYRVVVADSSLQLAKQRRVVTNPFGDGRYPLSYSVLYQNALVSLFAPGYFACHNVDDWQRNVSLEKQLNTRRFERHWLIGGQLIGLASGKYWQYTPKGGWQHYAGIVPFKNRPKLFEDAHYLVYNECQGEFGGRLFFVDKQTQKTYWTESTCAVWVRHASQGYEILSSLGHGLGDASEQRIRDPRALPEWRGKPTDRATTVSDSAKPATLFAIYGVQLFGGLERQQQLRYLLHVAGRTCLASLSGSTFTVADPLFNDGLYTHNPVTTDYDGTTVINLDFYGIGLYQEVACLVFRKNQVTLLDWHERHVHF